MTKNQQASTTESRRDIASVGNGLCANVLPSASVVVVLTRSSHFQKSCHSQKWTQFHTETVSYCHRSPIWKYLGQSLVCSLDRIFPQNSHNSHFWSFPCQVHRSRGREWVWIAGPLISMTARHSYWCLSICLKITRGPQAASARKILVLWSLGKSAATIESSGFVHFSSKSAAFPSSPWSTSSASRLPCRVRSIRFSLIL